MTKRKSIVKLNGGDFFPELPPGGGGISFYEERILENFAGLSDKERDMAFRRKIFLVGVNIGYYLISVIGGFYYLNSLANKLYQ